MGQSNKKIRAALYIGIGASILSVIAIAVVVLYPYFLAKSLKMQDLDGLFGKKYVSEYDLKLGRNRDLKDNWNVAKLKKDDGTEYLRIVKIIDPDEPMDYLHFEVYENSYFFDFFSFFSQEQVKEVTWVEVVSEPLRSSHSCLS